MAGLGPLKMKRKDYDEVSDDFSDFSLFSPGRKIRRLDAGLPPIQEEDLEIPLPFVPSPEEASVVDVPPNDEKAIVLFKPMHASPLHSPSFSVDSDMISGFQRFWPCHVNHSKQPKVEDATVDEDSSAEEENLAVIPWIPYKIPQMMPTGNGPIAQEPDSMDIDSSITAPDNEIVDLRVSQQQQFCMTPNPPQTMPSPIPWYH